jgi:RNA-binding protein
VENPNLTGAQKAHLRGLGQRLDASIKLGKDGLKPGIVAEIRRQVGIHELVKVRFVGVDRGEKAPLCVKIAEAADCECVGAVGHTALFYRQNPDPALQKLGTPA